ncbi:DUF2235 domain-containing protein [[Empedobacter] haloabium]|uniref:DUF2235 domain-containing protein n=1 Tax=[Empedobacter] haloabium TaxID=592317 RepID=A0ABZ1UJW9_9BURK
MTEALLTLRMSATSTSPIAGISIYQPLPLDASSCEKLIQVGIFFDGTNNNRYHDEASFGDSNVSRLYGMYPSNEPSVHRFYVNGVGTEFPEIAETKKLKFGSAFGSGGYARILYVILQVINQLYLAVFNIEIYSGNQVKGLCSNRREADLIAALHELGRDRGLLDFEEDATARENFFFEQLKAFEEKLVASKVKLKECILDVFGFSRGAAQARVFCSWIERLTIDGKLAGVPLTIRFLGIFDTVASAGVMGAVGNTIVNSTGGHSGWARARYLRISPKIKNCVHLVAMHEIRKNFPLDEVSVAGVVPPNCREFAYPGSHSDVGGGYAPGELGLACGTDPATADAHKLSQIPLRHMMECAIAAGVPLRPSTEGRFAIAPELEKAYQAFLTASGTFPRMLSEWMAPYMAWRWQMRAQYDQLGHVSRATGDRKFLIESNDQLVKDARRVGSRGDENLAGKFVHMARSTKRFDLQHPEYRQEELTSFDPEAPALVAAARAAAPVNPELAAFFDTYVHDSLAGFRKDYVESTGYWRHRRCFRGSENPELTQRADPSSKSATTA